MGFRGLCDAEGPRGLRCRRREDHSEENHGAFDMSLQRRVEWPRKTKEREQP